MVSAILLLLEKGSALSAVGSFSLGALGPGLKNSCGVSRAALSGEIPNFSLPGWNPRECPAPHVLSSTSASWHDLPPAWGSGLVVLAGAQCSALSPYPPPPPPAAIATQLVFLNKGHKLCHRQRRGYLKLLSKQREAYKTPLAAGVCVFWWPWGADEREHGTLEALGSWLRFMLGLCYGRAQKPGKRSFGGP